MTADVELLPCPFCRGRTFIHHGHNGIGFITCGQLDDGSDGCGVVASFRPNKGGREAIAAWNRRATAAKDAEIEALRAEVDELRGEHVRKRRALAQAKARAERLSEALQRLKDLMLEQVKWEPCDCGCPQQRTPDGPHSVTWLRAAQQVEIAINKAQESE